MPSIASSHDGTPISFTEWGSGAPEIVFVPGLTGDRSDFAAQIAHFQQSNRVVALDLPGHGASGSDRAEWSMEAFGEDVATLVEDLELNDVVLVGHSFGGDVVVEAALLLEGRIKALVMVSSYRSLASPPNSKKIAEWLAPFEDDFRAAMNDLTRRNFGTEASPKMVSDTAERMMSSRPDVVLPILAAKFDHEPALIEALAKLDAPVFAVNPDFKPNDADSLASHGVQLRVINGVGHYTMMEAPDAFNVELADILAEL